MKVIKYFSEPDIKNDEEFIEACHNVAKGVFQDEYDAQVTEDTAKAVLRDYAGESYGKMLGVYRAGITN